MKEGLTIGRLARRVGMSPSALRYYEELGLLVPGRHTDAGYRLYDPQAEQILRFIRRAQRIGFSLADIRTLLGELSAKTPIDDQVIRVAEQRFIDLERRLTELLVLRHEMSLWLLELRENEPGRAGSSGQSLFDRLVDRVCDDAQNRPMPDQFLDWLIERTHCALSTSNVHTLLAALRWQHVHIWKEDETYQILVVSHDPAVKAALEALARLEANCHVHPPPNLEAHEEGFLFTASGENAFLFARLFLALEQGTKEIAP